MTQDAPAKIVPPTLTSWGEFSKVNFPEEKWLIQNLLPLEGLAILASPSGEKKTWVALHMAYCIAMGKDFLGHTDFKVQKSKVLYLDQEMSRAELQRRGKLLGFSAETEGLIIPVDFQQIDLSKDEYLDWLLKQVIEHDVRVIFIDTLRAVAGGLREDKAEEVREFLNKFLSFKKMGLCIIFLDHCRKAHPFEGKTPKKEQLLGSQDKVACLETLLMIKSDERNPEVKVYPKKNRNGIEYEPFSIVMESLMDDEANEIGINIKYGGPLEGSQESKSEEAKGLILTFLADGSKTAKQAVEYLGAEHKIGESNVRFALRELSRANKVRVERQGRENVYGLEKEGDSNLLDSR